MRTPTQSCFLTVLFLFFAVFETRAQFPTNADCLGAIPVCQSVYTFSSSVHGIGNYSDLPYIGVPSTNNCPGSCIAAAEQNSTWYIFTIQNSGLLNFTITPISASDDYDWAVYNLTTNNCSDIYNGGMQVSCNYCLNAGPTGANGISGYWCEGPNSCSSFNAPIPAVAGETYVLLVDNFSSSNSGYTLDFTASTAQIFDNIPPQMNLLETPVICGSSSLNVTFSENILCSTISAADFTLTGPGGPYSITYVSGQGCDVGGTFENTFNLLVSPEIATGGSYSLNLVNSAGSVTDACGNIAPVASLNFTVAGPSVSVTPLQDSICPGNSVNLTATGANSFSWSPSAGLSSTSGTSVSATPLATTVYTVVGTIDGCTDAATASISVVPFPNVTLAAFTDHCVNEPAFALTGGSPAGGVYSGPGVTGGNFNPSLAGTGTHMITYTYSNSTGCTSVATRSITVNPLPTANFTVSPVSGCITVPVTVTYTGTAGPGATYNWSFDGGTAVPGTGQGPHTLTFGNQGTFTIILNVSENGCNAVPDTVSVSMGGVNSNAAVVHDVLCNGGNSGEATVSAIGGIQPLNYSWNTSPVQTTQNATGLASGTYVVTVTDNIGCLDSDTVNINEPAALSASITDSTMIACFGDHSGMVEVTATGGTLPYSYLWASSSSTADTAGGYYAGNYSVTVSDANGCSVTVPFMITQNSQLSINMQVQDEGCAGNCDGIANALVTGGSGPYSYLWSPGSYTTQSITVCPGNYVVTVTDQLHCSATSPAVIMTNTIINAEGTADPAQGSIPLTVNFSFTGSGAATYQWDFGDGTGTSYLPNPTYIYTSPGTYTVVLTVNSGSPDFCEDVYTLVINVAGLSSVEIPNVYTPNGDGFNDAFTVKSDNLASEEMVIFNRWGREVYRWGEVHGKWDGTTSSGNPASDGEYYFIYKAHGMDGKDYNISGTVTLLR